MPNPTRFPGTLTVKKPSSPGPIAAALTHARPSSVESPFDRAARVPLSVAALLAGGDAPALGWLFGALAVPADDAMGAITLVEENSDDLRSE